MNKVFSALIIFLLISACSGMDEDKDFPVHLQTYPYQCGPVCLKMICDYYELDMDQTTLEICTKMDKTDGTSLLTLSDCASSLGLENLAVGISYEQLLETQSLPANAHWDNNHFVVVYKANAATVWVVDPRFGKVELEKEAFCQRWSQSNLGENVKGALLIFEQLDEF